MKTPEQYALGFDPATQRLWFKTTDEAHMTTYAGNPDFTGLGSVDPALGSSSTRSETTLPVALEPDRLDNESVSPDGKLIVEQNMNSLTALGFRPTAANPNDSSSMVAVPEPGNRTDRVVSWIDDRTFIASDQDYSTGAGAVYKVAVDSTMRHATATMIAPSGHEGTLVNAVADPTHQQVALLMEDGTLWLTPASGNSQPKKLTTVSIPANSGSATIRLIEWTN